ncbi:MAG: MiaB/RimO family radical SAM methylthiotransferase [Clostridia bacterium]|nr:MiaB/RimO family radical SAM methylthiotransferase [Clostridia bacterium]
MKFVLKNYGCQMNVNTAAKITQQLLAAGHAVAATDEEADAIIFNTCCVRNTAEQKILSHIALAKQLKRQKPNLKIAVIGCLSAKRKINGVDILLGTDNAMDVVEKLGVAMQPLAPEANATAYIDITYGCDNYCSYCIVPYVRGHLRIRPYDEIIAEFNQVKDTAKNIYLLGQNVNEYPDFPKLLAELAEQPGDFNLHFLSAHPKDFDLETIKVMARYPKIAHDVHLPMQSGCDKILKLMNRKYTVTDYLEKVKLLREYMPDIHITTDIICGFPGETDEDFDATVEVVKQIKFSAAYIFPYSNRSGTVADKMSGQVPFHTRKARATKLVEIMRKMS